MLSKKRVLVGAAAMTLAFSTAMAVYAESTPKGEAPLPENVKVQAQVHIDGEGGVPFDERDSDELPKGMMHAGEVSMNGEDGLTIRLMPD